MESFYAIRRADKELIDGEHLWSVCDGPDDWTIAQEESRWADEPIEFVIVKMTEEVVAASALSMT